MRGQRAAVAEIRPSCLNPSATGRKGEETLGLGGESAHKSSSVLGREEGQHEAPLG